jgi:SAM-dependent methyltransferase
MRDEVMAALRDWYPEHLSDGRRVLELGSRDVYGGVPRTIFTGNHRYTGIDMLAGKGVDKVMNFHDLKTRYKPRSVDTVLCLETLEHDDRFWLTLQQVARVLKRGGHFVLSIPTLEYRQYHPYPEDYYRFTKPAFTEVLLDAAFYESLDVREISTRDKVDTLAGIGRRR